jgi:hypothetical protein
LPPAHHGDEDVMALFEKIRFDGEGVTRDALHRMSAPIQLGADALDHHTSDSWTHKDGRPL